MTGRAANANPAGRDPETRAALSRTGAFAVRRRRLGPHGFALDFSQHAASEGLGRGVGTVLSYFENSRLARR